MTDTNITADLIGQTMLYLMPAWAQKQYMDRVYPKQKSEIDRLNAHLALFDWSPAGIKIRCKGSVHERGGQAKCLKRHAF